MPSPDYFSEAQIRQIVDHELKICPRAGLIDIYKLLYQAYQGPNHIAISESRFAAYLKEELCGVKAKEGHFVQDIGAGNGFFRIHLPAFLSGGLALTDDLLLKFTKLVFASKQGETIDQPSWSNLWNWLEPIVEFCTAGSQEKLPQAPEHRAGELELIHDLIRIGGIPHHTALYVETYEPHYRLIHVSRLEEAMELLNLNFFEHI